LGVRARIAAFSWHGLPARVIATVTQTHVNTVRRWVDRVRGGAALTDQPRSGRPRRFAEATRLKTIAIYCQQAPPLPGVPRWSLRDAERYFDAHPKLLGSPISRATIHRILQEHALRPHRRRYYLQITDPAFFPKMELILQLYLDPPEHLFCFDECTCIQALQRLGPDLPAAAQRAVYEEFEYRRHGTCDLMAFLDPATGQIHAECTAKHDHHTLARVFRAHVQTLPGDAIIHYVMDNLSPHYHDGFCQTVADLSGVRYTPLKTGPERRAWLQSTDKRIVVHFIPFHASWLNRIEVWFGILNSKCLRHGHFLSVDQLCEEILAFIQTWNECFAHPFSWSYTGEGLHAKVVRRFCRLLAIETDQMTTTFLKSQLLLMSNLADHDQDLIPPADWLRLQTTAAEKRTYIHHLIDTDPKPRRREQTQHALARFEQTVLRQGQVLAQAS
jgi:transposase